MPTSILIIIYIFSPAVIIHLCQRYKWMSKVGTVLWAYVVGLILSNLNLLPENAAKIQDILTTLTVPLAIPLMLFTSNLKDWKSMAKNTILSLLAGILAITIAVILGFFIFRDSGITEVDKVGGLLIGVYTGGTANLAALKLMLDVNSETYLALHTYDMVVSFVFLMFMVTIGQRALAYILPKTPKESDANETNTPSKQQSTIQTKAKGVLLTLSVSVVIFAVSGAFSLLFDKSQQMVSVILSITTLGILASLNKKINTAPLSFETGTYLILIFSVVVASMVDIRTFTQEPPTVFYYIIFTVFVSVCLHVLISKRFRVDVDTTIVVSTALINSPAFVPFVATAIQNKKVMVGGITAGLIGFALGNYLGYAICQLLARFL